MNTSTVLSSLGGGVLIGAAATLVLLTQGRIAGVSGMCSVVFQGRAADTGWRLAFLLGLVAVGLVTAPFFPAAFSMAATPSWLAIIAAGLLVGFGTRLGNGCTSGHGVCGVARLSPRSLVATATFMFTGAITVYLARHLFSGVGS